MCYTKISCGKKEKIGLEFLMLQSSQTTTDTTILFRVAKTIQILLLVHKEANHFTNVASERLLYVYEN